MRQCNVFPFILFTPEMSDFPAGAFARQYRMAACGSSFIRYLNALSSGGTAV
jgi:hypothetical protein